MKSHLVIDNHARTGRHLYRPRCCAIAVLTALQLGGCGGAVPGGESGDTQANPASGSVASASNGPSVLNQLIAIGTPGATDAELASLFDDSGATIRERFEALSATLLEMPPEQREQVRSRLGSSPLIEQVAENRLFEVGQPPADPALAVQWHLAAIHAQQAWDITTGSPQIVIAILDTGVDTDHPDLQSKLRSGANTADGAAGWEDAVGHGTSVAGVAAAATNNQSGIAGVAPGSPLLPIRVTGAENHASSWAIAGGIAFAVNAGAKVVNVSIDSMQDDSIVLRQTELARRGGALVVFSSGNTGLQVAGGGSDAALFVGAVAQDLQVASFSTYGDFVDLAAPGVGIYTTQLGGTYGSQNGTSLAAPVVSGVAALVWSINPRLRPTTVRTILLQTAQDIDPPGDDIRSGVGVVDAKAAVELARGFIELDDKTAPSVSIRRPADGVNVNGDVVVEAVVDDDSDLADVALLVDGTEVALDTIRPYAFRLNTGVFVAGVHRVTAAATDAFGNVGQASLNLDFAKADDNAAPTVTIESPAPRTLVRGVVTIVADARDGEALSRGELWVDGALAQTIAISGTDARLAFSWNAGAASVAVGSHALQARVFDTAENAGDASVELIVSR
ncbi:MAG: S8 family serine peptidase [Phycisphaerae bacterium]